MQEKVRKALVLKLVDKDFQKRKGTCHISNATTMTRQVTMLKIALINQTTITKVSTKVRVRGNIMHIQQITMSIRRRNLAQILHPLQIRNLCLFQLSEGPSLRTVMYG